jgi:ATP-dependent Clp protease ATP-binding subunit ClpA
VKQHKEGDMICIFFMPHEKVIRSDIAKLVIKWTGVHISKLQQYEREKLLHLVDDELHKHVVGQDPVIKSIAKAIHTQGQVSLILLDQLQVSCLWLCWQN